MIRDKLKVAQLAIWLREFRVGNKISFKDLSKRLGISVSYLNEIEKGKKYPKPEKFQAIMDLLESQGAQLKPLGKTLESFLQSDFFDTVPIDSLGFSENSLLSLIISSPGDVEALINAVRTIAERFDIGHSDFAAVMVQHIREGARDQFELCRDLRSKYQLEQLDFEQVASLLKKHFKKTVSEVEFGEELKSSQIHYICSEKEFWIESRIPERLKLFYSLKVLSLLDLSEGRFLGNSAVNRESDFKNFYSDFLSSKMAMQVAMKEVNERTVEGLLLAPPAEELQQGLKNSGLQKYFLPLAFEVFARHPQLENLFFLEAVRSERMGGEIHLTQEVHIGQKHSPQAKNKLEHYCERWITLKLLKTQKESFNGQISIMNETNETYLCLSQTFNSEDGWVCHTIGIKIEESNRAFLDNTYLNSMVVERVGQTCERCSFSDCSDRAAPAYILEKNRFLLDIQKKVRDFRGM